MAISGVTDYSNTYVTSRNNVAGSKGLSETAKNYLSELKQKYSEMNITVADFKNEKQSDAYMFGSSGCKNVAISAAVVEKMATDQNVAAKYEKIIGEIPDFAKHVENFAKEENQVIYGSGVVIDKNGKTAYWIIGGDKEPRENPGSVYKEKVQKQLEEIREKKREEALKEKKLAKAESAEELLKALKESKYTEKIAVENEKGNQVDISI